MSMNLYLVAERTAFAFNRKGEQVTFIDKREFQLWSTPTDLTNKVLSIVGLDERVKTYEQWAGSQVNPYDAPVYDFDAELDENCDYPIIGYKLVDLAKEHIDELRNFINESYNDGFDLKFYTV